MWGVPAENSKKDNPEFEEVYRKESWDNAHLTFMGKEELGSRTE